jgi:hypothetical protein
MPGFRRSAFLALLLALPIEGANLSFAGMVFDPGPLPSGILPRLFAAEWVFFHFVGLRNLDRLHALLGTEKAGLVVVVLMAYLQIALACFLFLQVINHLRVRRGLVSRPI